MMIGPLPVYTEQYLVLDVVVNVHAFADDGGDLAAAQDFFVVNNPVSLWGPKLGILVTQTILADGYLVCAYFRLSESSRSPLSTLR